MELKEWQKQVDDWINSVGVRYFDELTNLALLMEETGEFARLMARMYGEQNFKIPQKPIETKLQIEEELADIFFVLTCLANQMGIDLTDALSSNIAKKTKRDKDRHQNNPKLQ